MRNKIISQPHTRKIRILRLQYSKRNGAYILSRLVVIGNGFDLAHGLHTKYSDFMKYLCSYEKKPEIIHDGFIRLMIAQDLAFAKDISHFFSEWILHINTSVHPILPSNILNKNCLFLNFNYTDTLEKVYNIPASNILYIHANALRGNNLILGHHDATLFQGFLVRSNSFNGNNSVG